jgi:hypothetical protein
MFAEISTIRNNKNRKNFKLGRRAAESLAGARGKCFLWALYQIFFRKKRFSDNDNPPPQISVLYPKKQISCPGAQQKFSRGACWGVTTN